MAKRPKSPKDRRKKKARRSDSTQEVYQQRMAGGFVNPISGTGTSLDKNSLSFFTPTRMTSKNFNEIIYVESWAAKKFIDIPVDDMFMKWRTFRDMENQTVERVKRAETEFGVKTKLARAIKAGRLYGTGLFIILTKESSPENPLSIERMMPGDLSNILTIDRFDCNVVSKNNNPYSKNYGKPVFYNVTLKMGGSFVVHHSRVIRFDGITSISDNAWQSYDQDWGVASLIPVITEIYQDSNVSKGVASLVNEASVAIQKIEGFEDALSGGGDEMSLQDRMSQTSILRSIYRTIFIDSEDSFERSTINFAGLPDLMDRNAVRLAAAADIPETRFWSKALSGLNSTGEGEARNYALKVASDQENQLPEPLRIIDMVLGKHLGLSEKICYEFPSILDLSEKDKVESASKKALFVVPLVTAGIIDEDEARAILDGDPIIGDLDDFGPVVGESVDEFKNKLANVQIERARKEGLPNGEA